MGHLSPGSWQNVGHAETSRAGTCTQEKAERSAAVSDRNNDLLHPYDLLNTSGLVKAQRRALDLHLVDKRLISLIFNLEIY